MEPNKTDKKGYIDSWDIMNLSPRIWWPQALYVGLTWGVLVWSIVIGTIMLLIGSKGG